MKSERYLMVIAGECGCHVYPTWLIMYVLHDDDDDDDDDGDLRFIV